MNRAWSRGYLLGVLAAASGYLLLPSAAQNWLYLTIATTVPLAITAGVLVNRPTNRWAWLMLGVGEFAGLAGDVTSRLGPQPPPGEQPTSMGANIMYLAMCAILIVGLGMFAWPVVRRNRSVALDAVIVVLGVAAASWVFLMAPVLTDPHLTTQGRAAQIVLPVVDLVTLTVAFPVMSGAGPRPPALRLLLSWLYIGLISDSAASFMLSQGQPLHHTLLDTGWLVSLGFLGAAALHPTTRDHGVAPVPRRGSGRYQYLSALVASGLLAPAMLVAYAVRNGEHEVAVVATTTALTALLAFARIGWLIRVITAAQSLLSTNETMLEESQRLAQVGNWNWELATGRFSWSPQFRLMLGLGTEVPPSFDAFIDCLHPDDRLDWVDIVQQAFDGRWRPAREQFRVVRAGGDVRVMHAEVALCYDDHGNAERIFGTAQDITVRHRAQQQAAELAAIVEFSHDAVLRVTPQGVITLWNGGAERLFGYKASEIVGLNGRVLLPQDVLNTEDPWHNLLVSDGDRGTEPSEIHETVVARKDGRRVPVALSISQIRDSSGRLTGGALIVRDMTQHKRMQEQLTKQALHDPLTGLANRSLLLDYLGKVITTELTPERAVALIFIDLDDFKLVNDSLGHHAGDRLLKAVAQRLGTCARAGDMVARLGGDEFAVVLNSIAESDARYFADRLLSLLQPGVDLDGTIVSTRASIGIATHSGGNSDDPGTLLRKADLAMYAAKRTEKGGYRVFADEIEVEFTQRIALEAELRNAIVCDEFHLHYQPIVALSSGRITGFEALLRWRRPDGRVIGPDTFVPVLESCGLISQVGEWVLRQACEQAATWRSGTGEPVTVSVNVSPPQLNAPNFVDQVIGALRLASLPAGNLTIEITEGVMVADVEQVIAKLTMLRDLGIRMAIDDFGTGYSSLRYLQTLPVDIVKIDRSFIAKIQEGRERTALAGAIIQVGHALSLSVVAEGVETEEQAGLLRNIGCEYGQGYHFARPQPPERIPEMLRASMPRATPPP